MPLNPFDLTDPTFEPMVRTMSPSGLRRQLDRMADTMGDEALCAAMAREIVARTRLEQAIPGTYAHYRSLIHDGIAFFLSIHGNHLSNGTGSADGCVQPLQIGSYRAGGNGNPLLAKQRGFSKMGICHDQHPAGGPQEHVLGKQDQWLIRDDNRMGSIHETILI
jgi:hypothetical protein